MNIKKTNRLGLMIAERGMGGNIGKKIELLNDKNKELNEKEVIINNDIFKKASKIIRVSKNVVNAALKIEVKTIFENATSQLFEFDSLFILLDSDKTGFIKISRFGSDIYYLIMTNLDVRYEDQNIGIHYNSFSFISKDFQINYKNETSLSYDLLAVKLLTYLLYGNISEKKMPPKAKITTGYSRLFNNSKLNIVFCDTLWKQRINISGFPVSGHFRFQPFGKNRKDRKLIWIEEFEKKGYNRKATVELIK
jgi:hypothetical protein